MPFGPWPTRELTLTGPDREALRAISTFLRLPPRTQLFDQGRPATHIYNVLRGCLYSERRLPNGTRRGMALLLPGDLSGLASRGLYVNSVRTLTDTDVLKIPLDALKAMLLRNASLHFLFLCKTAHMIRESQRQILLLSRNDPVERLALLISTVRAAPAGGSSNTIPLPATGREIASYLDLSPGQLSRALDSLVTAGVVHYSTGMLRVVNPRKLQRIVDHASGGLVGDD